jgi:hypothetical protein
MIQTFSRQLALERQQGYRGPATRFVGPIDSLDEANLVVRECSIALIVFGAIQVFLVLRLGYGSIAIGAAIIVTSAALLKWPGLATAATVVLLSVSIMLAQVWMLAMGYVAPLMLPSLSVLVAARGAWAAWRRSHLRTSEIVADEAPS